MVRFRYTIRSMLLACTIVGSFLGGWRMSNRSVSRLEAELVAAEAQRDAALASARVAENRRASMERRLAAAEFFNKFELKLERSKTRALKTRLEAAEMLNRAVERHKPNSDASGNR